MSERNGNGVVSKTLLGAAVLAVTIVVTLIASGGSWGQQKEKVRSVEEKNVLQDTRLDCHDKDLTALKMIDTQLTTQQESIIKALDKQDGKIDQILRRLPARSERPESP